jgi:hypothetical protein
MMPKLREQLPHSIYFKYGTLFILDEMNLLLLLKQLIIIIINGVPVLYFPTQHFRNVAKETVKTHQAWSVY